MCIHNIIYYSHEHVLVSMSKILRKRTEKSAQKGKKMTVKNAHRGTEVC